jgi:hypothetical protein
MPPAMIVEGSTGTTWETQRVAATPLRDEYETQWSEVRPVSYPDWMATATAQLRELLKLKPGWDSDGSPPVSRSAVEMAMLVLTARRAWFHRLGGGKPQISPVSGGGIQLEWEHENRSLELEVHSNGALEFLKIEDDESAGEGPIERLEDVKRVLEWLIAS